MVLETQSSSKFNTFCLLLKMGCKCHFMELHFMQVCHLWSCVSYQFPGFGASQRQSHQEI